MTKTQKTAEELAEALDISLKHMRAPIGVTGVWYKNNDNPKDNYFWYAKNWTEALKKINGTKKCKKKKAPPRKKKPQ